MEVKWIKLTTDMFDNRKIRHLRRLPEGNSIVLIWVMLLTLAGRCNAGGLIFLTENIPYTPKMLADELDFEENTVALALEALERLGMISANTEGFLSIESWEEHQNIEGMEKIRASKRMAQARWRAKRGLPSHVDSTVDSTVDTTRISVDDAEEDKNKNKSKKEKKSIYGTHSNVFLTKDEYQKLADDFGEEQRDEAIEFFSSYIAEKDYKSKSHYLSMRRWVFKAINERRNDGHIGSNQAGNESTEDDDDRFYSKLSSEECDRILAEYEAEGI